MEAILFCILLLELIVAAFAVFPFLGSFRASVLNFLSKQGCEGGEGGGGGGGGGGGAVKAGKRTDRDTPLAVHTPSPHLQLPPPSQGGWPTSSTLW